jgi:hypothetical protein
VRQNAATLSRRIAGEHDTRELRAFDIGNTIMFGQRFV